MRKLISLLVVLGMMFVAAGCNDTPIENVGVSGGAEQWTEHKVGAIIDYHNNGAAGANYSVGTYEGEGVDWMNGYAGADGYATAEKFQGTNFREATATTGSSSYAGIEGANGSGTVTVMGEGGVGHNTYLAGNTGGHTWGSAAYGYAGEDSGNVGSHCCCSYGPTVSGSGMATTSGKTYRNNIPNGVASHAVSSSYAYSSGGGSLPQ